MRYCIRKVSSVLLLLFPVACTSSTGNAPRSASSYAQSFSCRSSQVMNRELFDYLTREKIADGPLIAKWRKPGYEILCSMLAVQKGNHNFGTTSHCRVRRCALCRVT